jgi:hypothetical protein
MYLQIKSQGKPPLNNEQTLNEGQECKIGHAERRVIEGGGGEMKKVK